MCVRSASRFGEYGGGVRARDARWRTLAELEAAWAEARGRRGVSRRSSTGLLRDYAGRPTPLYHARAPERSAGRGREVWLKREDLNHTGAHKINNALGQALLARRMGKPRIIAETGAGQHGVATRDRRARCSASSATSTWAPRTSRASARTC